MVYSPETGDVADALYRRQSDDVVAGDYLVEPAPKASIGDSTTSIEIDVSAGVAIFGNEVVTVDQQPVTLPDGPAPGSGPDGGDPDRVDLITVDSNGNAGRMVGQPAVADPPNRTFPNVRQPLPQTPQPSDGVVVIAAVNVLNGTGSSAEMFADRIVPREIMGDGLNDLDLIPGRDLQYEIDNAREGATLRGDRSQVVELDQPLTITTPDVTIRELSLRYAPGAAANDSDDMLTLAADGITVEDVTLDGNKANQTAEPDGITVTASDCAVEDVRATDTAGHAVNVNGGSQSVVGTRVEGIHAEDCRKDALVVQGTGAKDTNARDIRSERSGERGTLTVRNGTTRTTVEKIRAANQRATVTLEDFGPQNDASAQLNTVQLSDIHGEGVLSLVDGGGLSADVSEGGPGIGHNNIEIEDARAYQPQTPSGAAQALIQISNATHVTVSNATLSNFNHTSGVWLFNCFDGEVGDSYFNGDNSTDETFIAPIRVQNCSLSAVHDNIIDNTPSTGIYLQQSGSGTMEGVTATGNRVAVGGNNTHIRAQDGNGTLTRLLIKDNLAPTVDVSKVSGTVTETDNI